MEDDVAELLGAGIEDPPPVPQASRELRVEAYETALNRHENLARLMEDQGKELKKRHIERSMLNVMRDAIDEAQDEQDERRGIVRVQDSHVLRGGFGRTQMTFTMHNVDPNVVSLIWSADPPKPQLPATPHLTDDQRQAFIEIAERLTEFGVGLTQAFQAMSSVISAFADDAIAAMRPLLDLLDEGEDIPRQPLCPSHAIAMRGGRCIRCDRRKR